MLNLLRVRDLAIIDRLEVELGPGLNVITGETGAGKSILIAALSLVLGERGQSGLVRTGAAQAEVEALFDVGADVGALDSLVASGLERESELVVRRVVKANGRTRAYLNGRLASASQLSTLIGDLVNISSQHEHHTLVDPATHLEFLDAFGELGEARAAVRDAHRVFREADAALRAAEDALGERGQREDFLRFQIKEIEDLDPQAGEDVTLAQALGKLRHAEQLTTITGAAEDTLYARDGALTEVLGRVANEVRSAAELDGALAPLADALDQAVAEVEEVARELGSYARSVSLDEQALADTEERLARLKRVTRKYGGELEQVLAFREEAATELAALANVEEEIEALEASRLDALGKAGEAAQALSQARRKIADTLAARISEELETLGMGGARVEVQVERLPERRGELTVDGARLSETGIDRVEFLIAPNKGEQPRPLSKVASGGELSRAMLAIKRVLAGVGRAELYVFDEVDAGVGGAVAEVIGRKLADVARHHQVICVTHLAQIAVYADRHFRVHKQEELERTVSRVEALDEPARLEEIARMVGGVEITSSTRKAAKELLRGARGESGRVKRRRAR